jgi:hypothetical protein
MVSMNGIFLAATHDAGAEYRGARASRWRGITGSHQNAESDIGDAPAYRCSSVPAVTRLFSHNGG